MAETPQGALFYASTRDGRTFTPRHRIPTLGSPKPSHPQIVVGPKGGLVVAWDEVVDGKRRAAARTLRLAPDGKVSMGEIVPIGAGDANAYPVMAMTPRGLVTAWTNGTGAASLISVAQLSTP